MIKPWLEKDIKNEVVLLDNISGCICSRNNRNTHDRNEYAKCLEFKISMKPRVFSNVLFPYLRQEVLNRLYNYRVLL